LLREFGVAVVFFALAMGSSTSKFSVDLKQLAPGFHQRRFSARGVGFEAFIWRGALPGPVLLLNGATHGDEYEGPTLLRQWAEHWRPKNLRGTVVMVPVLNEGAFYAGLRSSPADDVNLARAFPGNARGSVTQRLAHLFDTQLFAQVTHYVDLHSAGRAYELLPWTGFITHEKSINRTQRAMAACFDAFWCWDGPFLPGRTLSAAHARNIAAIYVECRGTGDVDPRDLRNLDRGLRHLLTTLEIIPAKHPAKLRAQIQRTTKDADEAHLQIHHPAPHDGLFVPAAKVGAHVRRDQVLGTVHALNQIGTTTVRAERTGRIVMWRIQRSVRKGDALCTLAPI
jgi:N-alpha-acetyl-L-2,4-diaminobutyrate deacetylase